MTFTDKGLQAQIVIAASIIAGKGANENEVSAEIGLMLNRLSEGSSALNAFNQIARRDAVTEKTMGFPATILFVDFEVTSNRAVVFFKTKPSTQNPNGKEMARTNILKDNPAARDEAKYYQSLIGHNVFVNGAVENTGTFKVRVIRNIEDKGVNPDYNPENPEFQPDMDSTATLQKMRARLQSQGAVAA